MKKSAKLISLLLVLTMLLGIIPMAVAAGTDVSLGRTSLYDVKLTKAETPTGATLNQTLGEGPISKDINERGLYKRLPRNTVLTPWTTTDYLPVQYVITADSVELSDPEIIGELQFSLEPGIVTGWKTAVPCIEFDYKAIKNGSTDVTLKFFYKFDPRSGLTGWYYDVVTFTVNVSNVETQKPDQPDEDDVYNQFWGTDPFGYDAAISFWCNESSKAHHTSFDDLTEIPGAYSFGEVVPNENTKYSSVQYPWMCEMQVYSEACLDAYNYVNQGKFPTHYLRPEWDSVTTVYWFYSAAKNKWLTPYQPPIVIEITHTAPAPVDTPPDAPEAGKGFYKENAVKIECTTVGSHSKTYDLIDGSYSVTDPVKNEEDGSYTSTVTIYAAKYIEKYKADHSDPEHTEVDTTSKTINLKWTSKETGWQIVSDNKTTPYATFTVKCETVQPPVDTPPVAPGAGKGFDKEDAVKVECTTVGSHSKTYDLIDGSYSVTDPVKNEEDGSYTSTVTIYAAKYIEKYKADHSDPEHTEVDTTSKTINLKWTSKETGWQIVSDNKTTPYATFTVKCTPPVPTKDNTSGALDDAAVTVTCSTVPSHSKTYAMNKFTSTTPVKEGDAYTSTITVSYDDYDDDFQNPAHTLTSVSPVEIEVKWDGEKWVKKDGSGKVRAEFTVKCTATDPLNNLELDDFIKVVDKGVHTEEKTYSLYNGTYTTDYDAATDYTAAGAYCTVTISNTDGYTESYNDDVAAGHSFDSFEGGKNTFQITWNSTTGKWEYSGDTPAVTINVKCTPEPTTTPVYVFFRPVDSKGKSLVIRDIDKNKPNRPLNAGTLARIGFEWADFGGYNFQDKKFVTVGKLASEADLPMNFTKNTSIVDREALYNAVKGELTGDGFTFHEGVNQTKIDEEKLLNESIDWYDLKFMTDKTWHYGYKNDGYVAAYHLDGTLTFYSVKFVDNSGDSTVNLPFTPNYTDAKYDADQNVYDYYIEGESVAMPANPTRNGYVFTGWKVSGSSSKYFNGNSYTMGQADVVFEATWAPKVETVTLYFDSNGGTAVPSQTIVKGSHGTKPAPDPTRTGYTFTGWYVDPACTTLYDFDTVLTADRTVYAGWSWNYYPIYRPVKATPKFNTTDHFAYVQGYPNGSVKPTGNITRAETAAILFRLMDEGTRNTYYSTKSGFRDVSSNNWFNTYVATLNAAGVITDSANGYFRPNDAITRAELAAMLAQFADTKSAANYFNDVAANHWAANAIAVCVKLGWINGYPDGSFRPDNYITRAELMAMINRATGRTPKTADAFLNGMKTWTDNLDTTKWYYVDVQEATNSHDYIGALNEKWTALRSAPNWSVYE